MSIIFHPYPVLIDLDSSVFGITSLRLVRGGTFRCGGSFSVEHGAVRDEFGEWYSLCECIGFFLRRWIVYRNSQRDHVYWSGSILYAELGPIREIDLVVRRLFIVCHSDYCLHFCIDVRMLWVLELLWWALIAATVALCTRSVVIIADIIVILVTWLKTGRAYREARRQKVNAPLSRLLLRDGQSRYQGSIQSSIWALVYDVVGTIYFLWVYIEVHLVNTHIALP